MGRILATYGLIFVTWKTLHLSFATVFAVAGAIAIAPDGFARDRRTSTAIHCSRQANEKSEAVALSVLAFIMLCLSTIFVFAMAVGLAGLDLVTNLAGVAPASATSLARSATVAGRQQPCEFHHPFRRRPAPRMSIAN